MNSGHLSEGELVRLAIDAGEHPHTTSCMGCAAELSAFRVLVEQLRALPDPPERLLEAATDFFRRRRALEALLERLTEDAAFRARARAKPDQVLREAGIEPVPELVQALRESGRSSGDLARRIAAKHLWL
jgi:hypothetical protein